MHGVGGNTFWKYATTDAQATVTAANYFDGAADLFKLNDPIWVEASDTSFLTNIETRDEPNDTLTVDTTPGVF
jgi:hypothetical protein